jgi:hypothetical protein
VPMRAGQAEPSKPRAVPPDRALDRAAERSVAREAVALGDGEPSHDLRGPREREHGESGAH